MNIHTPPKILIEVCANSYESAMAAQRGGAHRVELCSALIEGGITPSAGAIEQVRQDLKIPLNVMIRPRGGDFCYSDAEFKIMERDIVATKKLGADGVVIGILTPEGLIDTQRCKVLVELAFPMSVTFHRAFDMANDLLRALDAILELNVNRLLTSGGQQTAMAGAGLISKLVRRVGEQLIIMPGSGIKPENISLLVEKTGAREFHLSGQVTTASRMAFRNPNISMGGVPGVAEYEIGVTDAAIIRRVVEATRS